MTYLDQMRELIEKDIGKHATREIFPTNDHFLRYESWLKFVKQYPDTKFEKNT